MLTTDVRLGSGIATSLVPRPFEGEEKGPGTYIIFICKRMHQLPQENQGYHKRLHPFYPPSVEKGTR